MSEAIREQRRRLLLGEVSRVVPGLYSWLATVLVPVSQRGASATSRVFAGLSLLALGTAFVLFASRPRLGRMLGVYGFVLSCLAAWAFLGAQLQSDQLDPVRSALGAVGFLLHALAWGAPPRHLDDEPVDNLVPGSPLQPRHRPLRTPPLVFGLGILLAVMPLAMAFGVERPGAALLAHALALGSALLLTAASIDVALRLGKERQFPAWRARAARAIWPLGALTFALGIGLLWLTLR
ncbi:MAG TPA: hypothetical protein VJN18_05795 [Polyangiaceae bacterium]|nr:hypothetical protein [Polyangiaceae bacterium]